jgi:hypothetical protein
LEGLIDTVPPDPFTSKIFDGFLKILKVYISDGSSVEMVD